MRGRLLFFFSAVLVCAPLCFAQDGPAPAENASPQAALNTSESLDARLEEVRAEIETVSGDNAEGLPQALADAHIKRITTLQDLENVLQRRITSLKRIDETKAAQANIEQQRDVFETSGLDTAPPYTFGFLDGLRDDYEAAVREAESETRALETQASSIETTKRLQQEAEEQRRTARDNLESIAKNGERTLAQAELTVARLQRELAGLELSQAEAQQEIAEAEKRLNEERAELLGEQIAFVRESVKFTKEELQAQLDELQARQDKLARELREAQRTDTANQRQLEQARAAVESAGGEDAIRIASENLAAREAWAQASSRAIELLQERIDNLAKARTLWETRFGLRRGADEAQMAKWEEETSTLLTEYQRRREDLERRMLDLRLTQAEIENRLASPDISAPIKEALQSRLNAIQKRSEQADAYLAGLIAVERLAQRVLADVQEERRVDTWRETWSRVVYTTGNVWNYEVFVIDDRSFRTGALVTAVLILSFVLGLAYALRALLRRTLLRHLRKTAQSTTTIVDDVLLAITKSTRAIFVVAIALYIALKSLPLSNRLDNWLDAFAIIAVVYQVATWGTVALQRSVERIQRRRAAEDPSSVSTFGLFSFFGRVAIWTVALLIALQNLGIEITAFIATLGVGGIAVAFALQNILGDVFCSVAILLDKPFVVGDFIIVGDLMGTVEHIGIKTTRLRSLGGEQIVFSNADLIGSRIRNYKRMYERRVLFPFGIVYETSVDKIEEIPGIVRTIIEGLEQTRFDRAHFKEYGDFSLNFEVVYYVLDADYNRYMDIQQRINLELYREFERRDISFAYPTQELIVRRNGHDPVPAETAGSRTN